MASTAILENATEYGGIEQLYVGQFTINGLHQTHTNKSAPENCLPLYGGSRPSLPAPFQRTFSFPITHVAHSTHAEQKAGICATPGKACFIAQPKERSQACPDGSYKLNYEEKQWKKKFIEQEGEYLLPGKYAWFSMKPTLPEGEEFNKDHYPVPYVNDTTFYGPWSFNFEYTELIEAYRNQIPEDAHVVLKNGGTLVYKREVCYVVIITHSQDETHDDGNYPTILEDNASGEVPQSEDDASTNVPQPEEAEATHKELEFGNNCNDPPTFYPRCVPPPYPCDVSDPEQRQWRGYDWDKLGHYDHVVFAVHCDWEGNSFEIVLPKGQPSCFFSDPRYNPDDEETYYKFHPLCLLLGTGKKGNGQYYPLCYNGELKQWEKTKSPSTPHTLESSEEAAEALPEI